MFCRFNGALLAPGNKISDKWDKKKKGYSVPSDQILKKFWDGLPTGKEVTW